MTTPGPNRSTVNWTAVIIAALVTVGAVTVAFVALLGHRDAPAQVTPVVDAGPPSHAELRPDPQGGARLELLSDGGVSYFVVHNDTEQPIAMTWDTVVDCANGAHLTAPYAARVGPHTSATQPFDLHAYPDLGRCDLAIGRHVEHTIAAPAEAAPR